MCTVSIYLLAGYFIGWVRCLNRMSEKKAGQKNSSKETPLATKPSPATTTTAATTGGSGRGKYWGYIGRIVFVALMAVVFSWRKELKQSMFGGESLPSLTPPERSANLDLNLPTSSPPLNTPESDYYNPPFDPASPPEPVYAKSGVKLITKSELAAHGYKGMLRPLWLALMGKVFDVDKGEVYYGVDGGYNFFTGIDGAKAFVTGEFNDTGLIDDVSGLGVMELGEVDNWVKFYETDYTFVGKLIGRYYTRDGSPTKEWYKYQKRLGERDLLKAKMRKLDEQFPPCNSHWAQATRGRVYCSEKSGGISRDWVGFPRRFFASGAKDWRCACVNEADLDNPHVKLYPDCDPAAIECDIDPEKIKEMRRKGL